MNNFLKTCTLSLFFFLAYDFSFGQASDFFITHGDNATDVSCGGVLFAPHPNQNFLAHNAGSVWLRKQIDLSKPFTTSFTMDLIDGLGVDGGAFVFQSDPGALGAGDQGLGINGIDHSVAITFDAIQNPEQNDPVFDHISIQANGDLNHSSANNLAGPVSIEPYYITHTFPPNPSVTSFRHLITIDWDPAGKKLSVSIDGVVIISVVKDLVAAVFGGNSIVYWGFTASNTLTTWRPANSDLDFGHLFFFFGQIITRFVRIPELDSCFGRPIQFIDSSIYTSGNGADPLSFVSWYWDFGDGATSGLRNPPPHAYPDAGLYTVKFTITNSSGCSFDTLVKKIKLGSNPTVDFAVAPLCTNTDVQFMDRSQARVGIPVSWTWQFDNGQTSTDKNPVTRFSTTGQHSAMLTVSTEYACKADTTITFKINEKPDIDYSFSKDCFGNVQFQSMLLNNVVVESWEWDFGDDHFSQQKDPSHFFSTDNSFNSKLWAVSGDCPSDTIVKTIDISRVHAFAGNDTIAIKNQPIQLNATGGSIYSWSPALFLNDPLISNPVATLPGNQTYILTVTNADGCEAKDTLSIKVYEYLDVYVPSAFTPNSDGKNDVLHMIAPGLKQLNFFRIYNRWGQTVFETKDPLRGWDGTINGAIPSTGVYVWIMNGVDYLNNSVQRKGTVTLIR